jgi:hypothetical protein
VSRHRVHLGTVTHQLLTNMSNYFKKNPLVYRALNRIKYIAIIAIYCRDRTQVCVKVLKLYLLATVLTPHKNKSTAVNIILMYNWDA